MKSRVLGIAAALWLCKASTLATMVLSTAISDLLLALCAGGAAVWLLRQPHALRRYAALGMGLMAFAAALGSLRFAGVEGLVEAHRGASRLAGAVAPGSFALAAAAVSLRAPRWAADVGAGALLGGWAVFVVALGIESYRLILGTVAVLVMLAVSAREGGRAGAALAAGGLALGLAGLVIGTDGSIGPLLRVDVFHVVISVAHLLVAWGLVELPGESD